MAPTVFGPRGSLYRRCKRPIHSRTRLDSFLKHNETSKWGYERLDKRGTGDPLLTMSQPQGKISVHLNPSGTSISATLWCLLARRYIPAKAAPIAEPNALLEMSFREDCRVKE
jgi:hypothetical protein